MNCNESLLTTRYDSAVYRKSSTTLFFTGREYIHMIENQPIDVDENSRLVSLTPEYIEEEHVGYVLAIEAALANKQIRNIALSGNYGVGKSSILQEVARRKEAHVVEISLSTLSPIEVSKLDESVPKQATTPTNRIQQEIVKQLLYREEPSKTPGSRFKRIERFRWQREAVSACLLGFAVAVIFLLSGWTAQVVSAIPSLKALGAWIHAVTFSVASCIAFLIRWRFYGKLHIKQFSAGAATVTLDDNSVSYFDQYLDEIVYFFEVSDRNIVIFEDIDRFNDSHIFETLRALNTLLNASPQIKRPVCFIYAVKDSIFDNIALNEEGRKLEKAILENGDPALAEVVRANRTKFFDLIIPVVPFITHRSARNLVLKQLGNMKNQIAPELIDLASQYVPDMRLLKNIRNEYMVFRARIFSGDGEQLNLSKTDLFAMMLYKNTHLTDFETIRIGKSKLDVLYKISRELVASNIKRLEGEYAALRYKLEHINTIASKCERLGEELLAHVKRTAEAVDYKLPNATFSFKGVAFSQEELKGESFWQDLVLADGDTVFQVRTRQNYTMDFTRDRLAEALSEPLDADLWENKERESITDEIEDRNSDIQFLRSADLHDLLRYSEFLVKYENNNVPLDTIARSLLKTGLAYQLIRAGYINRNFTLYTSTFHGTRVSTTATNYIIHHVERDLMDIYFKLTPKDVDAVVRERGKESLKDSALYNIDIMDHLLVKDSELADIMIHSLLDFSENAEKFMQAYLSSGEQRPHFIARLTNVFSRIIPYIVNQTALDDVSRLEFVDIALTHLPKLKQRTDSVSSVYLLTHYAELTALNSDAISVSQAERIGTLFKEAHIIVPRLQPLGRQVCQAFKSQSIYEITYENLLTAIDSAKSVALDIINTASKTVFSYVLTNLGTYLKAIEGKSLTIDVPDSFITIIEEVLAQDASHLNDVIRHAHTDCHVWDLTQVSEAAWQPLAELCRFPATFNNVSRYLAVFGAVDSHLYQVLSSCGTIIEAEAAEEEQKTSLATAILAAREYLSPASLRVELVNSLNLEDYLDISNVFVEVGDLFALLLRHNLIKDDSESYEHLAGTDWPTRQAFISESADFEKYMTPELVCADLAEILASDVINASIKSKIIDDATLYVGLADFAGLNQLAKYATHHGYACDLSVVQKMAEEGVAAELVIPLLQPHLESISRQQLFSMLRLLDGDYPSLTNVGYDKPRIPNTPADLVLLERLTLEGIVGKYDAQESPIKVNKKYK